MRDRNQAILITAGPTVEDLDPVRFLSNRATGTLGFALAHEALTCDKCVVLIHGPVDESLVISLQAHPNAGRLLRRTAVRSCEQMHQAVMSNIEGCGVVMMTAAVADYKPLIVSEDKIKKIGDEWVLKLQPTVDILKGLGDLKRSIRSDLILIGFALESGSGSEEERIVARLREANRKLVSKNLDVIVLDSPAEMGASQGTFHLLWARDQPEEVLTVTKVQLAKRLVQWVGSLREEH